MLPVTPRLYVEVQLELCGWQRALQLDPDAQPYEGCQAAVGHGGHDAHADGEARTGDGAAAAGHLNEVLSARKDGGLERLTALATLPQQSILFLCF